MPAANVFIEGDHFMLKGNADIAVIIPRFQNFSSALHSNALIPSNVCDQLTLEMTLKEGY